MCIPSPQALFQNYRTAIGGGGSCAGGLKSVFCKHFSEFDGHQIWNLCFKQTERSNQIGSVL